MKTLLTSSFFFLAFSFALTARATPSYWAAVYSTAYEKDTSPSTANRANYTAYYCTAETAASLFGGNTDVADIEDYMSTYAHFTSVKNALAGSSDTELTGGDYALGRYQFIGYSLSAFAEGSYYAVAFYKNEAFRVFDVYDTDLLSSGDLLFTDKNTTQGLWTEVVQEDVPEPTSGLLMLLGLAGLALKRKRG